MTEDAQQPQPVQLKIVEVPAELAEIAKEPEVAAVPEAPDAKAEEAATRRIVLMSWLEKLSGALASMGPNGAAILISRPPARGEDRFFWEQTGFAAENGTVYCKFGNKQYQPIGKDDGTGFYPTEGSKFIWMHDFAIVKLLPFVGAFKVQKKEEGSIVEDKSNPARLTDHERKNMTENMKGLMEEMERFLNSATAEEKTENQERLLHTIELASLQCPKLDHRLQLLALQTPELNSADGKFDLEKADAKSLAGVCIEYLRMKLADDSVRRHFEGNELVPGDVGVKTSIVTLIDSLVDRLKPLIPEEGKEWDAAAITEILDGSGVVYPPLRDILKPFIGSADVVAAAKAVLTFLEAEKTRLAKP